MVYLLVFVSVYCALIIGLLGACVYVTLTRDYHEV